MGLFHSKKKEQAHAAVPGGMPHHVAIIMDGNGRWARARGLPRIAGHKKGADALRAVLDTCRETGVKHLTVYAFSSENWRRPQDEISDLMNLLQYYLNNEVATLHENNIRLSIIGDRSLLSEAIREDIDKAEHLTSGNTAFHLQVAISYGSRLELANAVRAIATRVASGELSPEQVNEQIIEQHLYTGQTPDPDLLIRTGGEQRLSNFLLWQSAYTELYFTDVLWPDFTADCFKAALNDYTQRERRYGTIGA